MDWLRCDAVVKYFAGHRVLDGVSGVLRDSDKIGLVGANGAGKTTLLRILAGEETADGGAVTRARDIRLGYVAQTAADRTGETLRALMRSAFAKLHGEEEALRELERAIAQAAEHGDTSGEGALLARYAAARDAFERHGGFGFEHRMRSMLAAFGLGERDLDTAVGALSGGQRTRAALAGALLQEPDCLLLDEPTNHLDVDATRFLEELIARDRRPMIVVSHDRYFLDRVATSIWELERGLLTEYASRSGAPAYTAYVTARAERDEQRRRELERATAERKRREAAIAELRTHGSHNYAQVRSREKMLARLEEPQRAAPRAGSIGVRLNASRERARGIAIGVRGLTKAYGATLFSGLDLDLVLGERVAVVGPNGSGKSTLLKIVAGLEPSDAGSVTFAAGVAPAYFAQESTDDLPPGARAVDVVVDAGGIAPQRARALLGAMGLGGDAGDKPVESFSGGERRRIMLARLMARATDCLLLDEPTNDLDIASREALEAALDGFSGTMLVVSHDRYLLRRLADRTLELRDGRWSSIADGYDAYERSRRSAVGPEDRCGGRPSRSTDSNPADDDIDRPLVVLSKNKRAALEKALADREAEIERLERRHETLEREYEDPELYTQPKRVKEVHEELERVRAAMDAATHAWEHLVETLHGASP